MPLLSRLIGLSLTLGIFIWTAVCMTQLRYIDLFIDVPTAIVMSAFTLGILFTCFTPSQLTAALTTLRQSAAGRPTRGRAQAAAVFGQARQAVWGAGAILTVFSFIYILATSADFDPSAIKAGMSLALLPMGYAVVLAELVIAPCQQIVLNDFQSQDQKQPEEAAPLT